MIISYKIKKAIQIGSPFFLPKYYCFRIRIRTKIRKGLNKTTPLHLILQKHQ